MSLTKVIVKVGDSSDIAFRNMKAYRALTVGEFAYLAENIGASIIIVENIIENENDKVKQILVNFLNIDGHTVFFYTKDNDENTCGVADELELDIYLTLQDLHKAIEARIGVNVSTNIDDIKNVDLDGDDIFDTEDSPFDKAITSLGESKIDIEDIEHPTILTKDDLDDTDYAFESVTETSESLLDKKDIAEPSKAESKSSDEVLSVLHSMQREKEQLENQIKSNLIKIGKLIDLKKAIEDERDMYKNMVAEIDQSDIIEDPIGLDEYEDIKDELEKSREEITKLKSSIKKLSDEKASFEGEAAKLKGKALELENKALKFDENTQDNKLFKTKITELESELSDWKDKYSVVERDLNGSTVNDLKHEIIEWRQRVTELTSDLEQSESVRSNSLSENKRLSKIVESLEEQLKSSENAVETISNLTNKINELNSTIESLEIKIEQKDYSIALEKRARLKLMGALTSATTEICNAESTLIEKENEIERLEASVEKLEGIRLDNEEKIQQLGEKIGELTSLCDESDKRVDIAKQYVQSQLDEVSKNNIVLTSQIGLLREQLSAKELQYNNLVMTTGMDENGANTVLENAKNVEAFNTRLREQIKVLSEENEKLGKDKKTSDTSVKRMERELDTLRDKVKIMASSTGSISSFTMPPIQFNGRGLVIPVFGSGSFGITTTAMSLANKMSAQEKVLYIDFDMIMPKADGWFIKPPIIKSIPDLKSDLRATGLGILVNKGFQYWLDKVSNIIINCKVTKGGLVDYLSGFYTRPDMVKLVSTDFSAFLTYCANNYGYTIIDFGRIGASELSDKLIKAFTDAAYKSIFVSKNNMFEINISYSKLKEAGIDVSNTGWLLNMSLDTKIEKVKNIVEASHNYSFVPFVESMYGSNSDFLSNKMARDKFGLFIEGLLRD